MNSRNRILCHHVRMKLWTVMELVNPFSSSKAVFDLCTSKIPQMKKVKIWYKENKGFPLLHASQISIMNCKPVPEIFRLKSVQERKCLSSNSAKYLSI